MIENIEILTVNYNTPDLIDRMIKSVCEIEGDYPIRIIDGSDKEPFKSKIIEICDKYENVKLEQQGWNIHHGRGLDLGVSTSNYEWVILMDSDGFISQPIIEKTYNCAIENNKMMVGRSVYVNTAGISEGRKYSIQHPIRYFHASYLLFNKNYYLELKKQNAGFIHHGAIAIKMMIYLYMNGLSDKVGIDIWEYLQIPDNEMDNYFHYGGRGTVNRFGYNL